MSFANFAGFPSGFFNDRADPLHPSYYDDAVSIRYNPAGSFSVLAGSPRRRTVHLRSGKGGSNSDSDDERITTGKSKTGTQWQQEFNKALTIPLESPKSYIMRHKYMQEAITSFNSYVRPIAQQIVLDLYQPAAERRYHPVSQRVGNETIVSAAYYTVEDIAFVIVSDDEVDEQLGAPAAGGKAAAAELRALNCLLELDLPFLSVPLSAVLKFLGHIIYVTVDMDVGPTSLEFGVYRNPYEIFTHLKQRDPMPPTPPFQWYQRRLGEALCIAPRSISGMEQILNWDCQGHLQGDGHLYLFSLRRMMPPLVVQPSGRNPSVSIQELSHRRLRPEYVKRNFEAMPLHCDALMKDSDTLNDIRNNDVLVANAHLVQKQLPYVARQLIMLVVGSELEPAVNLSQEALVDLLHGYGINLCFLGALAKYLKQLIAGEVPLNDQPKKGEIGAKRRPSVLFDKHFEDNYQAGAEKVLAKLEVEMVARACKVSLFKLWRKKLASGMDRQKLGVFTADFLVELMSDKLSWMEKADEALWKEHIVPVVKQKFDYTIVFQRRNTQQQSTRTPLLKLELVKHRPTSRAGSDGGPLRQSIAPEKAFPAFGDLTKTSWGEITSKAVTPARPLHLCIDEAKSLIASTAQRRNVAGSIEQGNYLLNRVTSEERVKQLVQEDNHCREHAAMMTLGSRQHPDILYRLCALTGIQVSIDKGSLTGIACDIHTTLKGLVAPQVGKGVELAAQGRWDEAENHYRRHIKHIRKSNASLSNAALETRLMTWTVGLADLFQFKGDIDPAVELLTKSVDGHSKDTAGGNKHGVMAKMILNLRLVPLLLEQGRILDAEEAAASAAHTAQVAFQRSFAAYQTTLALAEAALHPTPDAPDVAARLRVTIVGSKTEINKLLARAMDLAETLSYPQGAVKYLEASLQAGLDSARQFVLGGKGVNACVAATSFMATSFCGTSLSLEQTHTADFEESFCEALRQLRRDYNSTETDLFLLCLMRLVVSRRDVMAIPPVVSKLAEVGINVMGGAFREIVHRANNLAVEFLHENTEEVQRVYILLHEKWMTMLLDAVPPKTMEDPMVEWTPKVRGMLHEELDAVTFSCSENHPHLLISVMEALKHVVASRFGSDHPLILPIIATIARANKTIADSLFSERLRYRHVAYMQDEDEQEEHRAINHLLESLRYGVDQLALEWAVVKGRVAAEIRGVKLPRRSLRRTRSDLNIVSGDDDEAENKNRSTAKRELRQSLMPKGSDAAGLVGLALRAGGASHTAELLQDESLAEKVLTFNVDEDDVHRTLATVEMVQDVR